MHRRRAAHHRSRSQRSLSHGVCPPPQCRAVDRPRLLAGRSAQAGAHRQGQAAADRGGTLDESRSRACRTRRANRSRHRHGELSTVQRLWRAAMNSWNGLRAVARSEVPFRQELFVFIIAVPLAFVMASEAWRRLTLVLVIVLIMIVELLNTAIEKLSDRVSREQDPRIGLIKDLGSAAVGLSLLLAGAVWLLALVERLGLI